MKTCSKCREAKALTEFYKNSSSKDGYRADCKTCLRVQKRAYNLANQEKIQARMREYGIVNADKLKDAYLRRFYNITLAEYMEIFEAQGGLCMICRKKHEMALSVDHDHACCPGLRSCGKCVRGLLCHHCNIGLGNFHDDQDLLARALDYLRGELTLAS